MHALLYTKLLLVTLCTYLYETNGTSVIHIHKYKNGQPCIRFLNIDIVRKIFNDKREEKFKSETTEKLRKWMFSKTFTLLHL